MTGEESGVKLLKQEIKDKVEQISQGIVPKGYKKTMLGIIPEDWEVNKLSEVSEVTMGQSPRSEFYNTEQKGLPLVQGNADIKNRRTYPRNYTTDITKTCLPDDIILSVRAPVGEISRSIHKACIGRGVCSIRAKGKFDSDYLFYFLIQNEGKWKRLSQGSTFVAVNSQDIRDFPITSTSRLEQQKIADILSTWDRAIELKESLVKEKEERKKGLMQRLLTSQDDWEEKRLGDISKIVTGTTPKTSVAKYYNGEYPWITPTDITDSKYIFSSERKLTKKGLEKGRYVPKGSLLVTCIASIGKNAILKNDGSCNQQINAIYPSDEHSNEFLYYLVSFNNNKLLSYAATTATAIINKQTFENIMFLIPPLSEQHRIAKILSTADQEIDLLKQEVEQLKEQKKGLMQLLLTGIVRVKEAVTSG